MDLDRVWHKIENWEEIEFGMWSDVYDPVSYLAKAISFTSDHDLYGSYMIRVVNEWPISCENALTDRNLNRRAWIGHAACALAMGCPEDITRKAWGYLTSEQQEMANRQADGAIKLWEFNYRKSKGIYQPVEEKML